MSLGTVLKNVYTFAQILGQASGNTASQWDVKDLKNAFKWARYCEQVHRHVKGKRAEAAVNERLWDMTLLLEPSSLVCLSTDLLGQASQVLKHILLESHCTNAEVLSQLFTDAQNENINEMMHILDQSVRDCDTYLNDKVLQCIEEECKDFKLVTGRKRCDKESPLVITQGRLLLEHIMNAQDLRGLHDQCESIFERVITLKHGWEILVYVIYAASCDEERDVKRVVKLLVMWMFNKSIHEVQLCRIPHFMLTKAALVDKDFYRVYLEYLNSSATGLSPVYHASSQTGRLYSWRSESREGLSFEDLLLHFKSLVDSEEPLRTNTTSFLLQKARASYFNVWRDICRKLH